MGGGRSLSADRIATLHEMLLHWDEAHAEANAGTHGGKRNDSRLLGFDPFTWTREYKELDRCLQLLNANPGELEPGITATRAYWHLRERYLRCTVVRREVHTKRTHSGERVPQRLPRNEAVVSRSTILQGKTSYMLVQQWDDRVDPHLVGVALRFIAREFRGKPAVYSESDAAA